MTKKGYKKLIVWQKADELAFEVYRATKHFPKEEIFGITAQLRRASLSVPTNIVEGYGRQSPRELRQFMNIALGFLAETEYLIDFSFRLKYLTENEYKALEDLRQVTGRLLWKFYKSLRFVPRVLILRCFCVWYSCVLMLWCSPCLCGFHDDFRKIEGLR